MQYRTAIIDGFLKVKLFCHVNPKLPKKVFDIEIHVYLKEKEKLTLRHSNPHGVQSSECITFNIANSEPDTKNLLGKSDFSHV